MTHGTPSVDPLTVLQWKLSIAQPAASNFARRWSSPMIPRASGRTGLLLVAMAWSSDSDRLPVEGVCAVQQARQRRA